MKKALSRILEFFGSHDRREQNNPIPRNYCICGALKPFIEDRARPAELLNQYALETSLPTAKAQTSYK